MNLNMNRQKTQSPNVLKLASIGILIVLIAYGSIQFYGQYKTKKAEEASLKYESLLENIRNKNVTLAKENAQYIMQNYANTPYGPLSALMSAKLFIEENKLNLAEEDLRKTLKMTTTEPMHSVARVRLAKVLAEQKNYEEAIKTLEVAKKPDGYKTLYEETKGDIYLMQKDRVKARDAYAEALKAAPEGLPLSRLQLKYNDVNDREGS